MPATDRPLHELWNTCLPVWTVDLA
jgi:hypothetical protein